LISYEEMTQFHPACWFISGTGQFLILRKMGCRSFMGSQLAHADPAKPVFRVFLKVAGSLISPGS
jgi:hypothetical protein